MTLDTRQRWLILGGLLTATLAAAAWVRDGGVPDNHNVVAAADDDRSRSEQKRPPAAEAPQLNLDKLDARSLGQAGRDPFKARTPRAEKPAPKAPPPAAVVAAPPPPPPPSAPPLPFSYMGKLVAGDDLAVFLIQGDRNLIVREGETIDARYRVERIAANDITFVYLPLNQRQTLNIGEAK